MTHPSEHFDMEKEITDLLYQTSLPFDDPNWISVRTALLQAMKFAREEQRIEDAEILLAQAKREREESCDGTATILEILANGILTQEQK